MESICTFGVLILMKGRVLLLPIIPLEIPERFVVPNNGSVWFLGQANGFPDCLLTQSLHSGVPPGAFLHQPTS